VCLAVPYTYRVGKSSQKSGKGGGAASSGDSSPDTGKGKGGKGMYGMYRYTWPKWFVLFDCLFHVSLSCCLFLLLRNCLFACLFALLKKGKGGGSTSRTFNSKGSRHHQGQLHFVR
jgi:hypothetical protein